MSSRPAQIPAVNPGEFVATRQTGNHITVWIEGRNQDGLSVAGTAIDIDGAKELFRRLGKQIEAIELGWPDTSLEQ